MIVPTRVLLLELVLLLTLSSCRNSALEITAAPLPSLTPILPTPTPGPVQVAVDGTVYEPGTYTLPPGSLVNDAVRAAGGPTADADLEQINLARELNDSDYVHVPRFGEVIPAATPYGLTIDGKIDINLADGALLETLPGIGPTYAQRIVEYREMNGPFETIEEVQEVKGIGPTTFEKIKKQIAVGERP